jgi:hypothetical protein
MLLLGGLFFWSAKDVVEDFAENPARAAAEMIVKLNPELELVETDDDAGTITIRNTETGEVMTLDYEDVAEGRLTVSTEEGEYTIEGAESESGGSAITLSGPDGETRIGGGASLEDVPDWVPVYPGATETYGGLTSTSADGVAGLISCTTDDAPQEVVDFYRQRLEADGYEIKSESLTTSQQGTFGSVTGELASQGRSLNIGVIAQEGQTQITINYNAGAQ